MSTIRANSIANLAGTGPAGLVGQSAAKTTLNLNGTSTIAVRDSLNISSVTDHGSGNYGYDFTTSFTDVGYTHVAGGANDSGVVTFTSGAATHVLTGSCRIYAWNTSNALADTSQATAIIHGDLA